MRGDRLLLVSLSDNTAEMEELAGGLGYEILGRAFFNRDNPHPRTYVGPGQAESLLDHPEFKRAHRVLVNADLSSRHFFNLERLLGKEVMDRIMLILEIFAQRSHSREADLQVELARLRFQMPVLREWVHMARTGERPGFLAGGEYQVSQYYELVQKRERKIERELEKIRIQRTTRRSGRAKSGFYTVSLGGYTNSGKSTLLRSMTGADVAVEDGLFTTLSTTTRRTEGKKMPLLISDTVGFFRDLPPWLIEAFRSTLEAIYQADLVLLVLDVSEDVDTVLRKVGDGLDILSHGNRVSNMVVVLNKADLLSRARLDSRVMSITSDPRWPAMWEDAGFADPPPVVCLSARDGDGLPELGDAMIRAMPDARPHRARAGWEHFAPLQHWLMENAIVTGFREPIDDEDGQITFRIRDHMVRTLMSRWKGTDVRITPLDE